MKWYRKCYKRKVVVSFIITLILILIMTKNYVEDDDSDRYYIAWSTYACM